MKAYDKAFMELALLAAREAEKTGEVPVGAVVTYEGQIIAQASNQPILSHNPCAHAEVLVLGLAGKALNNYRLTGCTLYVTLEPCAMCVSAMIHARIDRCVYGASDPKTGALGGAIDLQGIYSWNHRFEVEGGVLAQACGDILLQFFKSRRN